MTGRTRVGAVIFSALLGGCVGVVETYESGKANTEALPANADDNSVIVDDVNPEDVRTEDMPPPLGDLVEFTIVRGTGSEPWNRQDDPVRVYVGQTLRIHNDDAIGHILHTFGAPCDHGELIEPGRYRDHEIIDEFYPSVERSEVYDHEAGETARFWLEARFRDSEPKNP
ncbi:MAG: hypothetical protein AAGF12_17520 [Myxococcota bacterium]